jgi:hypothetical protein
MPKESSAGGFGSVGLVLVLVLAVVEEVKVGVDLGGMGWDVAGRDRIGTG